jgi:hypothetical protein
MSSAGRVRVLLMVLWCRSRHWWSIARHIRTLSITSSALAITRILTLVLVRVWLMTASSISWGHSTTVRHWGAWLSMSRLSRVATMVTLGYHRAWTNRRHGRGARLMVCCGITKLDWSPSSRASLRWGTSAVCYRLLNSRRRRRLWRARTRVKCHWCSQISSCGGGSRRLRASSGLVDSTELDVGRSRSTVGHIAC